MRGVYSGLIPKISFGKRRQFSQIKHKKCKDKDELYFSYNHGHKSWDTFAFLGRFPIQTGPIPPSPYKQCWTCVSRICFFRVSTLYRVEGGRTARKFQKGCTVLRRNRQMTEKYEYCSLFPRTFAQDCRL